MELQIWSQKSHCEGCINFCVDRSALLSQAFRELWYRTVILPSVTLPLYVVWGDKTLFPNTELRELRFLASGCMWHLNDARRCCRRCLRLLYSECVGTFLTRYHWYHRYHCEKYETDFLPNLVNQRWMYYGTQMNVSAFVVERSKFTLTFE